MPTAPRPIDTAPAIPRICPNRGIEKTSRIDVADAEPTKSCGSCDIVGPFYKTTRAPQPGKPETGTFVRSWYCRTCWRAGEDVFSGTAPTGR
jgi:Fe-S-cluster-containing hydrogenase component 2